MASSYPRKRGTPRPDYRARGAETSPAAPSQVPGPREPHDHTLDHFTPDVVYVDMRLPNDFARDEALMARPPQFTPTLPK